MWGDGNTETVSQQQTIKKIPNPLKGLTSSKMYEDKVERATSVGT
jgi:hypothetical protein